jgi:hypothetical protein
MKNPGLIALVILFLLMGSVGISSATGSPVFGSEISSPTVENNTAVSYLAEVMDGYHRTFDVYTDADAAGNHFPARGSVAAGNPKDVLPMDEIYPFDPHAGIHCIECRFTPAAGSWSGWYFMSGVLTGNMTQPGLNWGTYPDAGVNLSGASALTFWSRGAAGGERVQFFALGVGWNVESGAPEQAYPDSSPRAATDVITLTPEWKQYSIDLQGKDLRYVLGGFGWVATSAENTNGTATFYLDDIRYDKARLDEPRFLTSYETIPSGDEFDIVMQNVAFTYDNVVALLAFLAENDTERAALIADALVYAQEHDRYYSDGRLRNAYMGGDLILPPGWTPNGREGTVRMPGWYDATDRKWYEDRFQVSTHTGNVAWAMIGLLTYYETAGGEQYLDAAERMGEWIESNCYDPTGIAGYSGGYDGWEGNLTPLAYKSTEHNIDLVVAFQKLYAVTGNETWRIRAENASGFVEAMWDTDEGKFWIGTLPDGRTVNTDVVPLDAQAWSVLAFREKSDAYLPALTYSEQNLSVDGGFDFNRDRDGVWYEGTAQMAAAYRSVDDMENWQNALDAIRSAQDTATGGVPAASRDGLTTGLNITMENGEEIPWVYYDRLHTGATGWLVLAEEGVNPFWMGNGTPTNGNFLSTSYFLAITIPLSENIKDLPSFSIDDRQDFHHHLLAHRNTFEKR